MSLRRRPAKNQGIGIKKNGLAQNKVGLLDGLNFTTGVVGRTAIVLRGMGQAATESSDSILS